MNILIQFILLGAGFFVLVKGADLFVEGSAGIADRFGIPQLVIGLTIVAMGTSAPEAAVSLAAALKGSADITIGNVVGSNILNIFIILGITAAITSVKVAESTIKYEIPFMILTTMLLFLFGYTDGKVTFVEGIILWAAFVCYLIYLLFMAGKNKISEEEGKKSPVIKLILSAVIGFALIIWGSDITVDAATVIAKQMGLSERFIGLTIVALGTSLPELFTSISAAVKGKADIAIGNIVGSNIFNILFVVGTTSLITPVAFSYNFIFDMIVAAAAGVILLICVLKNKALNRPAGITMLVAYMAYFMYLII